MILIELKEMLILKNYAIQKSRVCRLFYFHMHILFLWFCTLLISFHYTNLLLIFLFSGSHTWAWEDWCVHCQVSKQHQQGCNCVWASHRKELSKHHQGYTNLQCWGDWQHCSLFQKSDILFIVCFRNHPF